MKRQNIKSMVIASALLFTVGITLAAEDLSTLKTPNGIAFFEIAGLKETP